MSIEENKVMVDRVWQEVFNKGNLDIVDELYDINYVYYGPGGYEIKGPVGLKRFVSGLRTSFPDLHFTVEDLIAEGDEVVSRWTMQGTHRATDKQIMNMGIIISRIADGKIVEDWEIYDRLYIAEQAAGGWIEKRMVGSIAKRISKGLPSSGSESPLLGK